MAQRRVYTDAEGHYFKGAGFKFRHPKLKGHTYVRVTNVSCDPGFAYAEFSTWEHDRTYRTTSTK